MDNTEENEKQLQQTDNQTEGDAWEEAFATLEQDSVNRDEPESNAGADESEKESAEDVVSGDQTELSSNESTNENMEDADSRGDVATEPTSDSGSGDSGWGDVPLGVEEEQTTAFTTQEEVDDYTKNLNMALQRQVVNQTTKMMAGAGVHVAQNGKLGYTLNDPDIYKYVEDESGLRHPVFINPDTGEEFAGDNPREQARRWIESYNEELKSVLDSESSKALAEARKRIQPTIDLVNFSLTFNKLDPIRQSMLDAMIQDYEIKNNNGDVIGYSCDLNSALDAVNRQIKSIRGFENTNKEPVHKEESKKATQPVLDMKASGTPKESSGARKEFKSEAEALEYLQDQQLEKLHKKDAKRRR